MCHPTHPAHSMQSNNGLPYFLPPLQSHLSPVSAVEFSVGQCHVAMTLMSYDMTLALPHDTALHWI